MPTRLVFLIFTFIASPVLAQELSRASYFDLTFKLTVDNRILGDSTITVEAGKRAVVTVDTEDGIGGYKLAVVGNPVVAGNGLATLVLDTTIHAQRNGNWQLVGEPSLQLTLDGERASVSVNARGPDSADIGVEVGALVVTPAQLRERFSGEIPQTQPVKHKPRLHFLVTDRLSKAVAVPHANRRREI